jgi:superoxide dismutase, Cu-Zn family
MKFTLLTTSALLASLLVANVQAADDHKPEAIKEAVAVIAPTKASNSQTAGVITLKQEHGYVLVSGEVSGLTPGKHGFHIHMFGDLRAADGISAGGHYNPDGHPHGGPHSKERHIGDLGNIEADADGVAKVNVKADKADLHMLLGRSLVVHGKADDLKSQPAGDAGPRVGIGVIGLAEVKPATAAK